MQDRSRELRLCKHIATASKHSGVDRWPNLTIKVIVRAKDTPEEIPFPQIGHSQDWEIIIVDERGECDALTVFYKAQAFWEAELHADNRRSYPERFAPKC
jgi:hypothetical protein